MKHRSPTAAPGDKAGANAARAAADGGKLEDLLHFSYFVVRLQQSRCTTLEPELSGVVERLASGEKCRFDSAAELLRLLNFWSRTGEIATKPG